MMEMAEIEALLGEAQVVRIALADENGPYIVPLCFGYEPGALYIHSSHKGKKIEMVRSNPRVCFEADICNGVVKADRPCSWGMRYRSVIGYGRAEVLAGAEEKRHGLGCIVQHYGSGTYEFSEAELGSVTVIRIVIESMTGKKGE